MDAHKEHKAQRNNENLIFTSAGAGTGGDIEAAGKRSEAEKNGAGVGTYSSAA